MSIETTEQREELLRLKAKLLAAEQLRLNGQDGLTLDESREKLRTAFEK